MHAASVDGILRSLGLRGDDSLRFTHKGKEYIARIAMHQGHEAIHIMDEKNKEIILVRQRGKWVQHLTPGQRLGVVAATIIIPTIALGALYIIADSTQARW